MKEGVPHLLPVCEIGVDIKGPFIVAASGSGLKPGADGLRQLLAGAHLLLDNAEPQAFSFAEGKLRPQNRGQPKVIQKASVPGPPWDRTSVYPVIICVCDSLSHV